MMELVLASNSPVRARLLSAAGIRFTVKAPDVDEAQVKGAMSGAAARQVAIALSTLKARCASADLEGWVIGADQTLEIDGVMLSKPGEKTAVATQLRLLQGREHRLHAAVSLARQGRMTWRTCRTARLRMRSLSQDDIAGYVERCGETVRHSVGGYHFEEEGIHLFDRVVGDYHAILGLPLLPLISALRRFGAIGS